MNDSNISLNDLKDFNDIPGKIEIIPPSINDVYNSSKIVSPTDSNDSVVYTSKGIVVQKLDLSNSEDFDNGNVFCPDNSGMDISGSMGREWATIVTWRCGYCRCKCIWLLDTSAVVNAQNVESSKTPHSVTPPLPRPPPPSPSPHHAEEIYASLNTVIGGVGSVGIGETEDSKDGEIQLDEIYDDVVDKHVEEDEFDADKEPISSRKSPMNKSLVEFEVIDKGSPQSSRA